MIREMKAAASALGGKTARACDSCLRVRARWFCAADDAFLCHSCDNLVHSANQLANKHERVRLQTASSSSKVNYSLTPNTPQAWHSGFKRKARTPRQNKQQRSKYGEKEVLFNNNNTSSSVLPLVPELGSEEPVLDDDETEEQLLCRVPVFDPFDSELCSMYNEGKDERLDTIMNDEEAAFDLDNFPELLPSDMDLADFAADVESLLGNGLVDGDDSCPMMIKVDCKEEEDEIDAFVRGKGAINVKVKDEELDGGGETAACDHLESIFYMTSGEAFDWNNIESETQQEEEKVVMVPTGVGASGSNSSSKVGIIKEERFLRLNYEEVIAAWDGQGSPWTTGTPPEFSFDDCWPDYLGWNGGDVQWSYGEVRSLRAHPDGGREARVSRYREKRRTRLFSKKIRYEVRKLNAEKRPRMKGRFVKRTSFVGGATTAFPSQLSLKSK